MKYVNNNIIINDNDKCNTEIDIAQFRGEKRDVQRCQHRKSDMSLAAIAEAQKQSAGSDDKGEINVDSARSDIVIILVSIQLQVMVPVIMMITHQHKIRMIHSF